MKIETNRVALSAALETCLSATDGKSSIGLLACVHLVAKSGKLTVNATDLNITAVVEVEIASPSVAGDVTVNAKDLRDVVRNAPGSKVQISTEEKTLIVKAGKFSRQMPVMGEQFPKIAAEPDEWESMSGVALAEVLKACVPAMCEDQTRFHMNSVCLYANGAIVRGAATDGHRLHVAERTAEVKWDGQAIVPAKAVRALTRLVADADEIQIKRAHEMLHVKQGASRLSVKLVDAQFPSIEQVIPTHARAADVERESFASAVARTNLESSKKDEARALALTFDGGELALRCTDPDGRRSDDAIDVEGDGIKLCIGVNAHYVTDALSALGGERVSMRLGKPGQDGTSLDPIVFHRTGETVSNRGGDLCVVMPMRV